MNDHLINRRTAIKAIPVITAGSAVGGCSLFQAGGLSLATLSAIIAGVQQAVALACEASGAIVPAATDILDFTNAILKELGTGAQVNSQLVIDTISAQISKVCPPAPVAAQPLGGAPVVPGLGAPAPVVVNGHTIHFISFTK